MMYTAVVEVERKRWNHHGSRKEKYETRQTPIAPNTLDHPPTHRPSNPRTHQPTHPRCATAIQQSTAADALMIQTELQRHWDFHVFTIIRHPGERADPSPGGPRSPSRSSHPFFHRQIVGLLCGKGVEPPRGCRRPSGARESQVFFG